MFFKYFSWQILFSRTFQDSPVYSSAFQACANPVVILTLIFLYFFENSVNSDQLASEAQDPYCFNSHNESISIMMILHEIRSLLYIACITQNELSVYL